MFGMPTTNMKTKMTYDDWGTSGYINLHAHADVGHVAFDCFCAGVDEGQGSGTYRSSCSCHWFHGFSKIIVNCNLSIIYLCDDL